MSNELNLLAVITGEDQTIWFFNQLDRSIKATVLLRIGGCKESLECCEGNHYFVNESLMNRITVVQAPNLFKVYHTITLKTVHLYNNNLVLDGLKMSLQPFLQNVTNSQSTRMKEFLTNMLVTYTSLTGIQHGGVKFSVQVQSHYHAIDYPKTQ